jgi:hypothetical protein
MKTTRMKLLVVGLTVLGLSAGVVAGMLVARLPVGSDTDSEQVSGHGPAGMSAALVDQLGLSADQQDKMRVIWEGVRGDVQQCFQQAQDLQAQRDNAVLAILNDEQKSKFQKISIDYGKRFDTLTQQREQAFQKAVDQTRGLLTEDQRGKYDQILKNRLGRVPASGAAATTLSGAPAL